ncbi:MAG: ROK family protein [Clostridiales bacterium]|nr:ROK family protein [Clostridiales bacterium]
MVYIGVDLGGTNIAVGVVNEEGRILAEHSVKTLASRHWSEVIRDMGGCILKALEKGNFKAEDVLSIGIGIPGVADQETGNVIFCTNLGWTDVPLRSELQKYINKPVIIDNDANVAALAENYAGVSAGCKSSVFITLGTGVGGGIVIDGKPWGGSHNRAGEIGHMTLIPDGVPCTCGNNGCVERYCSATALIRMGKQACMGYPDCQIMKLCGGDVDKISAKTVIDAAKAGDPVAERIFADFTKYLTLLINNITAFFDPEMIVIGGGVSHAGEMLVQPIRDQLPRYIMFKAIQAPKIELARLGNEAGIIGAAMLGK